MIAAFSVNSVWLDNQNYGCKNIKTEMILFSAANEWSVKGVKVRNCIHSVYHNVMNKWHTDFLWMIWKSFVILVNGIELKWWKKTAHNDNIGRRTQINTETGWFKTIFWKKFISIKMPSTLTTQNMMKSKRFPQPKTKQQKKWKHWHWNKI